MKKSNLSIFFLLGFLSFSLIVGCNSDSQTITSSNCRRVEHAVGETCVPPNPERIVTLTSAALDSVLVLGMEPVGIIANTPEILAKEVEGVTVVGQEEAVNLETILSLEPDLILAGGYSEPVYDQLSQIAPTVIEDVATNGEWKELLQFNAKVLEKRVRAEELLTEYQNRLATFREQLGNKDPDISLVRVYPDRVSIYLKNSFGGTILADAGLSRPSAQNEGIYGEPPFQKVISQEQLQQADGDVIFVWTFGATPEIAQQADQALKNITTDPLWSKLKAVQTDRVYEIGSYWNVSSLIAANAVIDDLFQYLIEE